MVDYYKRRVEMVEPHNKRMNDIINKECLKFIIFHFVFRHIILIGLK